MLEVLTCVLAFLILNKLHSLPSPSKYRGLSSRFDQWPLVCLGVAHMALIVMLPLSFMTIASTAFLVLSNTAELHQSSKPH